MMSSQEQSQSGLRERKKAKTRALIQQSALRLFREQGYHATTVEQIANAAEISPSTFFRYFPTKESVVLDDDYDPLIIDAFRKQPHHLHPIQAFRLALKEVFNSLSEAERSAIRERIELALTVRELRAAAFHQVTATAEMISRLLAERMSRKHDDIFVLTLTGALMGTVLSMLFYCVQHHETDYMKVIDEALGYLEKGFALPT